MQPQLYPRKNGACNPLCEMMTGVASILHAASSAFLRDPVGCHNVLNYALAAAQPTRVARKPDQCHQFGLWQPKSAATMLPQRQSGTPTALQRAVRAREAAKPKKQRRKWNIQPVRLAAADRVAYPPGQRPAPRVKTPAAPSEKKSVPRARTPAAAEPKSVPRARRINLSKEHPLRPDHSSRRVVRWSRPKGLVRWLGS